MSTTTRSSMRATDADRRRWPAVVAVAAMIAYMVGAIGVADGLIAVDVVAATALAGAVGYSMIRRRIDGDGGQRIETSLGEGLLVVVLTFVVARWAAGMVGAEAYGLVLLAVVWVVTSASGRVAAATVAAAVVVEAATHGLGTATATEPGPRMVASAAGVDWSLAGIRVGMVVAFASLTWLVVGRHAARNREAYNEELERERDRLLEEAREFRLIHAGRSDTSVDRDEAQELIVRDAVDAVHHTIFVTLELLKSALQAHTVVLLWFDVRNEELHIKELVSDSDEIVESTIDPAGGVVGGITRKRDTVELSELRSDFKGLAYYRNAPDITEFMGAPVIEEGHLRGVLCVDRQAGRAFDDEETQLLEDAAAYVLRVVENERMVTSIEQKRFEVGRFYEASRRLNGVLTPRQVYDEAMESIRQIAAYDFAAITLYDDEEDTHRVVEVDGEAATSDVDWQQVAFESNQGLMSMVVRNRHYLPVGGQLREASGPVMTDDQDFSQLESLVVLPLIAGDRAVGTIVIGHREPDQFRTERREMLEVVANQVAVTLQNARMYEEMETMAKYDALTGLANRRTFQTKLEETMARHKRAGRTFGLVLLDIDHFKEVNDTYGHPVGDEVLESIGETFDDQMREIDVPARYGGEEFALILEDTDLEGARQVAERLRKSVAALEFDTDQGRLQCTISLGIAIGPWDSDDPHELVDLADQALYYSKENGRNRVSVYREVDSPTAAA